jgi:hypothetical protein
MGKVASMNRVAGLCRIAVLELGVGRSGACSWRCPIMMSIKVFCDHVEELEPIGKLLSE